MKPRVKIISVGPGDPELLNQKTLNLLMEKKQIILRTSRHPVSEWLEQRQIPFISADDLYDCAEDFDALQSSVSHFIWDRARKYHEVVYAVPDSSTDRTVGALYRKKPENGEIEVIPGFSYADYYLASCRGLIGTSDIRISAATDFIESEYDPSLSLLITEIDDEILAGEVKEHLSEWMDDEEEIIFLDSGNRMRTISLFELDRQRSFSHLTAAAVKGKQFAARRKKTFSDLLKIMDLLRSPEGCPWDRAQTHQSLTPFLIEEAWETVDAIEENDPVHLSEELGDLLFQIAFHTSIGKSLDEMTIQEITTGICEKMIRRHPHVFGNTEIGSAAAREDNWEKIKQQENGIRTFNESLRHISTGLPSLRYAEKLIRRIRTLPGFSRDYSEIISAIVSAAGSLKQAGFTGKDKSALEGQLGNLLFLCAELACCTETDGEVILHRTAQKVIHEFGVKENESKKPSESPERLTFNDLGVY